MCCVCSPVCRIITLSMCAHTPTHMSSAYVYQSHLPVQFKHFRHRAVGCPRLPLQPPSLPPSAWGFWAETLRGSQQSSLLDLLLRRALTCLVRGRAEPPSPSSLGPAARAVSALSQSFLLTALGCAGSRARQVTVRRWPSAERTWVGCFASSLRSLLIDG